ncbi:hypothetical protein ABPG72_006506 [Tetrahymena utriculariae]
MLVNYDDSSDSEAENEKVEKDQKPEKIVADQAQDKQKKKVKLLNFNQVMKKVDEKNSNTSSSYTSSLLSEAKKIDQQLNNSNKVNNEINSKRKLPKDYEERVDCPVEQKYHKLNIKDEELQKRKIEEKIANQSKSQNEPKEKQKKQMFIPPQIRNNTKNVSTEF